MKATQRYNRIQYERGVTDGGRAYHGRTLRPTNRTCSYLAGFDRGCKIEMEKEIKADKIHELNKL